MFHKKILSIFILSFSLCISFTTVGADNVINNAEQEQNIKAITDTLFKYFEGTSKGKPKLVEEAFLSSAEIQWIDQDGKFRQRTIESYINNIVAGKFVPRYGRIVNIDLTHNAATVKAIIHWGERDITDYILLLKVDKQWKISNKVASLP